MLLTSLRSSNTIQSLKIYLLNSKNFSSVNKFGGPEVCEYTTGLPIPEPNENQIQIKIHAAGVNPVDTYIRAGTHSRQPKLPYTPGLDSAGEVTKVGENIKEFKVGDRVFTTNSDTGTYAEYTLGNPIHTFKLPDCLSYEEGSAIGIPYFTAYRSLFLKGNAKPGETLLIHGASGSVGVAACQLAKAHGMKVIGTAGSNEGIELVTRQGADFVFNHKEADYMEKIKELFPDGLDMIIEMLANVNLNNDLQLLRWKRGRVVVIGNRGTIEVNPRLLMAKETTVTGVTLFTSDEDDFKLMYSHIFALIEKKCIKPVIGQVYPLKNATKAQQDIVSNRGATGRLTLKIQP